MWWISGVRYTLAASLSHGSAEPSLSFSLLVAIVSLRCLFVPSVLCWTWTRSWALRPKSGGSGGGPLISGGILAKPKPVAEVLASASQQQRPTPSTICPPNSVSRKGIKARRCCRLGLEKKLELDELARARSSSARTSSTLRTSPSQACFCGS